MKYEVRDDAFEGLSVQFSGRRLSELLGGLHYHPPSSAKINKSYPRVCRWGLFMHCPNFITTSKNSFKEIPIVLRKIGSVIPEANGKLYMEPSLSESKERKPKGP